MQNNNSNFLVAITLSAVVLIGWTWFYEKPRIEKYQQQQLIDQHNEVQNTTPKSQAIPNGSSVELPKIKQDKKELAKIISSQKPIILASREINLEQSKHQRVKINSGKLRGSIYLKGAKFDDLELVNYHETLDKDSGEVVLLAPYETAKGYFTDFGWVSSDSSLELPGVDTIWRSSGGDLTQNSPITLSWENKQKISFFINIEVDENYMFSVTQSVKNNSKKAISLASYGRISRVLNEEIQSNYILHEGALGEFDGVLNELKYKDLEDEESKVVEAKKGWFGITDKYWLTSIIPDGNLSFTSEFSHQKNDRGNVYNVEFVSQEFLISANSEASLDHHLFAGAKKVRLLDEYSKQYDIELFDRAVDFGWYYFLTKPFFFILQFFNDILGNYGLAILAITVLIKLVMFPLANKSYASMGRIKKLQPKIEQIRKDNKDNKMQMNKEIMEMYKREKVNPASGCLPMLIQIPVFFSLYKVLFVTIDMRHTPFYGWIHDLSAPDPTSIFNLFGLLPFEPSGILLIGIWPILMGLTMILQQKLSPQVSDPAQAKVMKILPFILIFVFAAFPAGLLIYWTWSNILSVTQQWFITRRINAAAD